MTFFMITMSWHIMVPFFSDKNSVSQLVSWFLFFFYKWKISSLRMCQLFGGSGIYLTWSANQKSPQHKSLYDVILPATFIMLHTSLDRHIKECFCHYTHTYKTHVSTFLHGTLIIEVDANLFNIQLNFYDNYKKKNRF